MTYGILIKNSSGDVQIDTNTPGKGIIVRDSGTTSSTNRTISLVTNEKQLVFVRPTNRTTGSEEIAWDRFGNDSFVAEDGSATYVDYIIGVWADTVQGTPSGDYGLQLYNSDGELAFDSRLFNGNGGFGITNFIQPGTAPTTAPFNSPISTDRDKYYLVNHTARFAGFGNALTYFGYIFSNTNSGSQSQGVHWIGKQVVEGFGGPGSTPTTTYSTNPTILLGEVPS